jgi:hypothetical protein
VALIASLEGFVVQNYLGPAAMEHHGDFSMIGRHAVLCERIDISNNAGKPRIHLVNFGSCGSDVEHNLVDHVRVGQLFSAGQVLGNFAAWDWQRLIGLRKSETRESYQGSQQGRTTEERCLHSDLHKHEPIVQT